MSDEMVAIVLFIMIAVISGMLIVFKSKGKREQQETIRAAIEKGQDLTPELIERIGGSTKKSPDSDLRAALKSFAIGGGFVGLGFAIPDDDANRAMVGVASFPLLIGLAYLVMYFFGSRRD